MIRSGAHARHGQAVNNFSGRLSRGQSALAVDRLKDPYIFDFLTLDEPFHERELETGLVRHLEKLPNACSHTMNVLPMRRMRLRACVVLFSVWPYAASWWRRT